MLDRDVVDHQRGTSDQRQSIAQRAFFAAPFPEAPDDLYSLRMQASRFALSLPQSSDCCWSIRF